MKFVFISGVEKIVCSFNYVICKTGKSFLFLCGYT